MRNFESNRAHSSKMKVVVGNKSNSKRLTKGERNLHKKARQLRSGKRNVWDVLDQAEAC